MRKIVLFIHCSIDGYAAGPNGEMDWIYVDDKMFDEASHQTEQADTALYGRVTWQLMDSYWPNAGTNPNASKHDKEHSAWYNKVEKIVVSTTINDPTKEKTRFIGKNIRDEIARLKEKEGGNIIIFGSPTLVHTLTKENLIDEYWLFVNPIILGEGKPVFENSAQQKKLKLISSRQYNGGVMCLNYQLRSS